MHFKLPSVSFHFPFKRLPRLLDYFGSALLPSVEPSPRVYSSNRRLAFPATCYGPPLCSHVVPGRPIREVDLCLVHPWSLNREVMQMTISVVSSSKCPLESLRIISHLSEPTDIVLSSLETIPSGLSLITKFALHVVSGSITYTCRFSD